MHNRNISQAILKEFWKKIIEIWLFFQERKTLVSRYNNTYVYTCTLCTSLLSMNSLVFEPEDSYTVPAPP
jgi:hypothetical protein